MADEFFYQRRRRVSGTAITPVTSRVVVDGTRFRLEIGQPWRWQGKTEFNLPVLAEDGIDIDPYLSYAVSRGFNLLRCFTQRRLADGIHGQNVAHNVLAALADKAASFGLYLELVIQCLMVDDLQAHAEGIRDLARTKLNINPEKANEPDLHGYGIPSIDLSGTVYARGDYYYTGTQQSDGSILHTQPTGSYLTWHPDRGDEWPRKFKDATFMRDGGGGVDPQGVTHVYLPTHVPVVVDEPIGADETDQPGRRSANPDDFESAFAIGCLCAAGTTYHCQAGAVGQLITDGMVQDTIAKRIQAVWEFIPPEAYGGVYSHLQSLEAQFGALRIYQFGSFVVLVRPTQNMNQIDTVFQPKRMLPSGLVLEV